jgi:putative FmdB family regulatory protein
MKRRPRPAVHALTGRGVSRSLLGGTLRSRGYHRVVPIHEFRCRDCGEEFEALLAAGADKVECRACGSQATGRVYSAQAAPLRLAKTGGELRRQARANERLRADTKSRFNESRRRARERGRGG